MCVSFCVLLQYLSLSADTIPSSLNISRSSEPMPSQCCGHLSCGTHCSLTASAPLTVAYGQRKKEHRLQQLRRKEAKLRDLQGRELGIHQENCSNLHCCRALSSPPCEGRCGMEQGGFKTPVHVTMLETAGLSVEACQMDRLLTPEELQEKLKENRKYLMEQMCLRKSSSAFVYNHQSLYLFRTKKVRSLPTRHCTR